MRGSPSARLVPDPGAGTAWAPARVAHVFSSLGRGGAETATLDLCRSVSPAEAEQIAISLGNGPDRLATEFRAAGVAVRRCPIQPLATFPVRMWQELRAIRPDVLVTHANLGGGLITPVARAAGVPVRAVRIWSEADDWPDTPVRRAVRGGLRQLLRHSATDVLGVSGAALAFAAPPAGDPRYRVLYSGVDPARFGGEDGAAARSRWGLPPAAPVFVHVGRAIPAKNRPFLIEVHRAATRTRPDVRLLLAGPGGTGDLREAHPGFAYDPRVVWAGEIADCVPVYAAADVLLLPSRREGLPGVVLEALAAGVPVLAADLPSVRELAARVDGVTVLSPEAGAGRWAATALELAGTGPAGRERIRASLVASPYVLTASVPRWRTLWRS